MIDHVDEFYVWTKDELKRHYDAIKQAFAHREGGSVSDPSTWPENITVLLVDTGLGLEMHAYFTRDLDDCISRVRRGDKILATAIVPIPWQPYEQ